MTFKNDSELRIVVKALATRCEVLMDEMDRLGRHRDLLAEYEATDTLLIKKRMELLEALRPEVVRPNGPGVVKGRVVVTEEEEDK